MAPRTRTEWPTLSKTQQRSRRRRRKKIHLKMSPMGRTILGIVFSILALVFLVLGLILQSFLWYLVMAVAAGGALAQRRALQMQRDQDQEKRASRRPSQPKAKPMPGQPVAPKTDVEPQVGQIKCTDTGKPIGDCDCRSRHVHSADGVEYFGLPLGSPLGKRKKTKKPPKTVKN